MFPSLNVLTKLLFGISQKKNSGFVRFAHSILFNFQVPHICYRRTGLRCRLVDSLFILPQLFPFVKRFLKISFRKFSKRSALLIFRKVFKVLWTSVLSGVVSPEEWHSLAATCLVYHHALQMSSVFRTFRHKLQKSHIVPAVSRQKRRKTAYFRCCCRYSSGERPVWRLKTCEK